MLKKKLVSCNKMPSVGYVVIETKTINHISECSKLAQKGTRIDTTGWKGDLMGIMQENEI